jgi:plastocyanin domain-containing protein
VGVIFLNLSGSSSSSSDTGKQALSQENGKQIITFQTKGGYSPTKLQAKADQITTLRFVTDKSFDCSISMTIPSLKIYKNLPNTGTTDVEIPAQKAGSNLLITCSMGMYSSKIDFS